MSAGAERAPRLPPGSPRAAVPAAPTAAPAPLWRHPAFALPLLAAGLAALSAPVWWPPLRTVLFEAEFAVAAWLPEDAIRGAAWFWIPPLGFAAGLLASFSPCVLPLVPLNLAAIGAADARSRRRAAALSARFSLGAAGALALLGLAGDLAGWLLIEQRGPVLLLASAAMLVLAAVSLELLPLPFEGRGPGAGRRLGPLAAGAAFALVTTPCASPLLGAVLAAASAQALPGLGAVSMLAFALGYTALVFAAGVFGGSLLARWRGRSLRAPRAAAAALLLALGLAFGVAGLRWF